MTISPFASTLIILKVQYSVLVKCLFVSDFSCMAFDGNGFCAYKFRTCTFFLECGHKVLARCNFKHPNILGVYKCIFEPEDCVVSENINKGFQYSH